MTLVSSIKTFREWLRLRRKERAKKREADAFQNVVTSLCHGRLRKASVSRAKYYASLQHAVGIGIDWKHYRYTRGCHDAVILRFINRKTPRILRHIEKNELKQIRIGAGLIHLMNDKFASRYLAGVIINSRFDPIVAARQLYFHALHLQFCIEAREMKDVFKYVQYMTGGDDTTCLECRKLDNLYFNVSSIPEIPNPDCTCVDGCRCTLVSATEEDYKKSKSAMRSLRKTSR